MGSGWPLRYDLTAPLARFAAQNWETLPKPFRPLTPSARSGANEKPGPGRFREFIQCDADTVGSARPEADAEMVALAAAGFEAAGLPRGAYILKINSRKLLDGLLAEAGVADPRQKLTVLRAVDKLDRLGWDGVQDLLGEGPARRIGRLHQGRGPGPGGARGDRRVHRRLHPRGRGAGPPVRAEARRPGRRRPAGPGADRGRRSRASASPPNRRGSTPRWCGAWNTTPARCSRRSCCWRPSDDKGETVRFGSVGGGGRYDDLVARFTGQPVPATGFSFGVSRLAARAPGGGSRPGRRGARAGGGDRLRPGAHGRLFRRGGRSCAPRAWRPRSTSARPAMKAQMKYADRRLSPRRRDPRRGRDRRRDRDREGPPTSGASWRGAVTDKPGLARRAAGTVNVPRADLVRDGPAPSWTPRRDPAGAPPSRPRPWPPSARRSWRSAPRPSTYPCCSRST
ncbi:MAG: ATP phosphoribosyltransferase regulatory subunit [Caulobacteraceae bacterium]